MSLIDLTRNSFEAGFSAKKWLHLCTLFVSSHLGHISPENTQSDISNSVLSLLRNYPGDPALQRYLTLALQEGALSLPVFVASFLSAARSPELHDTATLNMLCQVALHAHYASGMPPMGSLVQYTESTIIVLGTVQDAMALLRAAYSLPPSQYHQLIHSASELLILLLSCVTDVSHISTAQAMMHFADASDLLQTLRLSPDVRQVLETFVLSLSLLLGDDAKAAREAQMMHTLQLAMGKGDILGPRSNTDIITFSLLLHTLVLRRANEFGAGDELHAVAVFVALIRWTSWPPTVFYTQLFLSAITCIAQAADDGFNVQSTLLWKAFIIGRLPRLLAVFEKSVDLEGISNADWKAAIHLALSSVLNRSDLINKCDNGQQPGNGDTSSVIATTSPFVRQLLHQLMGVGLIEHSVVSTIDPAHSNEMHSRMQSEAQDSGMDIESYFESKLAPEYGAEDFANLLNRSWRDPSCHAAFAEAVRKRFTSFSSSFDVESLSHLCKILYMHESLLEIVSLHVKLSELLAHALALIEDYDCETVGDPQTAVSHLGDVVLFLLSTLARFHLSTTAFNLGDRRLTTDVLTSAAVVYRIDHLKGEDAVAFNSWSKALFDTGSEGIDDTIMRSTRPKTLLRMAATVFLHAVNMCSGNKMDKDVFNNGVSYFLGPLLNWTLVGVVKTLLNDIGQKGMKAPVHLEVLQTLLLSFSCPRPVVRCCAAAVLRQFPQAKSQEQGQAGSFHPNINAIRDLALQTIGVSVEETVLPLPLLHESDWTDYARQSVRNALASARGGKAPALDVDRCLLSTPTKFLAVLWTELNTASAMGDIEAPCRIATFILSTPRSSLSPPLLPIFLHVVLPTIIASVDHLAPAEQAMAVELLVAVVTSSLTAALHIEWARLSVCNEPGSVMSQPSLAMARRLGGDLRRKSNSPTSNIIMQRLASSAPFMTNFPTFTAEL